MRIKSETNNRLNVSMTVDELGSIRYALAEGVEKLETKASMLKFLDPKAWKTAKATAKQCRMAQDNLEKAALKRATTPA